MTRVHRVLWAALLAAGIAACDNAGAYRTLGITATGVARGIVYFDANGSGSLDAADTPLEGARVRLVAALGGDTVVRATTIADGSFRVEGVPVGSYRVVVDPASVGAGALVSGVPAGALTLRPNDSLSIEAAASYPSLTAAQVRTATLGDRVFVTGVALHARTTFSDTTLHVVDTSGALRAIRVRPTPAVAGDSVRLRGVVAVRAGQRVLDDVTVFTLGPTFIATAPTVSTLDASGAAAGALDAALVQVLDAQVVDTATVLGSVQMTVNDGSGDLVVVLDRVADAAFRAPFTGLVFTAGTRYDIVGVLVPTGTGAWVLRPRNALDLIPR